MPGTTAKETVSAIESNSFPNGELTFRTLATCPSKPSATNDAAINQKASKGALFKMQTMAQQPKNRFDNVSKLGIYCFILYEFYLNGKAKKIHSISIFFILKTIYICYFANQNENSQN
jgi:hypothetical protein